MLHHLDLNVARLEESDRFYGELLGSLGWVRGESGATWRIWRSASVYITLVQAEREHLPAGFHRKRVGVNHIAFPAQSRKAVDSLHAWLQDRKVSVLYGGPMEMGSASEPNYAVFFEDPDRLKLEYVYRPEES